MKISKAYTRFYSDNRQMSAIVEWEDGSRTEGRADKKLQPIGMHMNVLFDRAKRDGLTVEHQTW